MQLAKWRQALVAAGTLSVAAGASAEEQPMNSVLTGLSSTVLSGYVDTSMTYKFGSGNANMPGRVYDGPDTQDGFNMNVVSLTLDKPLEPDDDWAAGYHVQMLLGPGAAKRGTGLVASAATTGFAFNEAYIALRVPVGNGIQFKVGQFGTYNGYEAFDTYKNPNWSRSYGFYVESSAHTGISASYQFTESISMMAGVGNTASFSNQVDARSTTDSTKAYLAMLTFVAPESWGMFKGAALSLGYTSGVNNGVTGPRVENLYAGLTIPTGITGLTVGLAYDYTADIPTAVTPRGSYANATAIYILYQFSEDLKFNSRVDYASGSNGAYGYTSVNTNDPHNELISYTGTVDYSIWKNVISRAEFRWDHALSGDKPFGGRVDGAGVNRNALSLTANFIYLF